MSALDDLLEEKIGTGGALHHSVAMYFLYDKLGNLKVAEDAAEELARLKAIGKAAESTFNALKGALSALLMWEESAPSAWDDTDIDAVDLANKALAEYEKAVKK